MTKPRRFSGSEDRRLPFSELGSSQRIIVRRLPDAFRTTSAEAKQIAVVDRNFKLASCHL